MLRLPLAPQAVALRRSPPFQVSASVLVVVTGCVIAGIGDLTFEPWGYVMALASCFAQAGYLLLVEFQVRDRTNRTGFPIYLPTGHVSILSSHLGTPLPLACRELD